MSEFTSNLLDYFLHWLTIFLIGLGLWYGAKIEGNKAKYENYILRKNLIKMFRKMKIKDLEK